MTFGALIVSFIVSIFATQAVGTLDGESWAQRCHDPARVEACDESDAPSYTAWSRDRR